MKTIAFNRSRGSMMTTLLVVGGLVGLYYYRNRGGSIGQLFGNIVRSVGPIFGISEGVSQRKGTHARGNYQMDNVDLDRTPAI